MATAQEPMSRPSPEAPGAHACLAPRKLRKLVGALLLQTDRPSDFGELLAHDERIKGCRRCRLAAIRIANTLADERREQSRETFANATPAAICRRVTSSQPPAWPPVPRWPEVEAVVDARHSSPSGEFVEIIRNLQLLARNGGAARRPTWLEPLAFLRSYLLDHATPAELNLAGLMSGSSRLQADAYRCLASWEATSERPRRDRWTQAAELLDPTFELDRVILSNSHRRPRITPWRAMVYAGALDDSVLQLERLEEVASRLCADATARGYAYSVVNLVRVDEGTIEAVAGTGVSARWVGRVRHPIHPHLQWREQDIQCDIVMHHIAELVMPEDPRLDKFVQEHFQHTQPRFFIPLIVVQDADGNELNTACHWEALEGGDGSALKLVTPEGAVPRAFGTLEVGIDDLPRGRQDFVALADFAVARAAEVYRCTLPNVLDTIVKVVRRAMRADSVTLHFGRRGSQGVRWNTDYCFRSNAEKAVSWLSPSDCMNGEIGGTPRPDGLGEEALAMGVARRREGGKLAQHNPKIWEEGYVAMTAFPLFAGTDVGVIYVHSKDSARVAEHEERWLDFVVKRASSCIRVARAYASERDRRAQIIGQLKTINALSTEVPPPSAREKLATGCLLGLAAADLCSVYKVRGQRCDFAVTSSGISFGTSEDRYKLYPLVESAARTGQYRFFSYQELEESIEDLGEDERLANAQSFIDHEEVRHLAVIPLPPSRGITGVVVLVFRRELEFDAVEQQHLALLASTVAAALGMCGPRARSNFAVQATIVSSRESDAVVDHSQVTTAWNNVWLPDGDSRESKPRSNKPPRLPNAVGQR